jgi:hypothetical protein
MNQSIDVEKAVSVAAVQEESNVSISHIQSPPLAGTIGSETLQP